MKTLLGLALAFGALTGGEQAFAEPIIDYVPVSAALNAELIDDVSGLRHWVVTVGIRNQGNVTGQPRTMLIRINGYLLSASVYGGPASGHVLYGAIKPGETGLARIALASENYDFVRALQNCRVMAQIHIDPYRRSQLHYLDYIYENDAKTMALKDTLWVRRCQIRSPVVRPIPPVIGIGN